MQYATVKQMQESLGAPGWKFTNAFLIKISIYIQGMDYGKERSIFSKKNQKIFDQNL